MGSVGGAGAHVLGSRAIAAVGAILGGVAGIVGSLFYYVVWLLVPVAYRSLGLNAAAPQVCRNKGPHG